MRADTSKRFHQAALVTAAALFLTSATPALADTRFHGSSTASTTDSGGSAHTPTHRATLAARKTALKEALELIEGDVDPSKLKGVLGQSAAWTRAYRVLRVGYVGDSVEVEVEVEINLPRLRKTVLQATFEAKGNGQPRFRLESMSLSDTCSAFVQEDIVTSLTDDTPIRFDSKGSKLKLELTCRDLGQVPMTHAYGFEVTMSASVRTNGKSVEGIGRFGSASYAGDPSTARSAALRSASVQFYDAVQMATRKEVQLVITNPWPASRVRQLEAGIQQGVVSVKKVEVTRVVSSGAVELRLAGPKNAESLIGELRTLNFATFQIANVEALNSRRIEITLEPNE